MDTTSSVPPDSNDDITFTKVIGYTGLALFVFVNLILILAGIIRLILKRKKARSRRLRNNTVSIFDLATVYQEDRDPYCTLGTEETRFGTDIRCLSGTRTHYTEISPTEQIAHAAKSQEDLAGGNDIEVLPRKCNTLSGILWNKLNKGYKKSATLDRYLTAQRGSALSSNDYVDGCQEDLKPLQNRPSYMSMAAARGVNSFVPEDDNLWERCSSDGSVEHDVLLRQDVDPLRADEKDKRLSTMSDLLRSSWMEPSTDKEYFNIARCGSQLSEDRIGGVFIPESDLDHPLQDGEADINQVSQNIINLITENFSDKIQKRESDDWDANVNDSIASKEELDTKMPSLDNVLPEPEKMSLEIKIERTNSFSPIVTPNPDAGNPRNTSETLPRSPKRPLPPVPRRKTPIVPKNVEEKTAQEQVKSADSLSQPSPRASEDDDRSTSSQEDEDDYENMPDVIVRMRAPSKPTFNPAKKIPPPPPPKPKKKLFQPQINQDSSPEGTLSFDSGSQPNFLKVTQELQQKLMFRLPGYSSFRAKGEGREEAEDIN